MPKSPESAGRWLVAIYLPVSLFSLRMTHATNKGGKTLVVPTPYSIKMALLDACFRCYSAAEAADRARQTFDLIKRRAVRTFPPKSCVVQNTFIKVLDHNRDPEGGPFKQTIAYREFVFYEGDLRIAIDANDLSADEQAALENLLTHLNTLGKRGGFVQFLNASIHNGDLPVGYSVPITQPNWRGVPDYGMVQMLDDFGEKLCSARDGFDRVSTYSGAPIKLGEHRILAPTAIAYRRRAASRGFTWYERTVSAIM